MAGAGFVGNFDPLPVACKDHRVIADHIATAQRGIADLTAGAWAGMAITYRLFDGRMVNGASFCGTFAQQ